MTPKKISPGRWSYRDYTITDDGPPGATYSYCSDDYDGAPMDSYGPPLDHRHGNAKTLDEAAREIDDLIEEEDNT